MNYFLGRKQEEFIYLNKYLKFNKNGGEIITQTLGAEIGFSSKIYYTQAIKRCPLNGRDY